MASLSASTTRFSSLAFVASLLWAGAAWAQEKNWSLKAGLSLWSNAWQAQLNDISPDAFDNNVISLVSERKLVPLGSAELRYKQYMLSGSYFKRSTYSFPDAADGNPFSTKMERSQYDLNVGWYFIPELALTAGYKNVQFRFTQPSLGTLDGATVFYDVFPVGFAGSAPLSRGLSLYGNLTGGWAKAKYGGGVNGGGSAEGYYWATEYGVGYALRRNLSANIGYRSETLYVHVGTQSNRDVLSGFLVGLSYTFF